MSTTLLLSSMDQKKNVTTQCSSPTCSLTLGLSEIVKIQMFQRALFEKFPVKVYVVISLNSDLQFWAKWTFDQF